MLYHREGKVIQFDRADTLPMEYRELVAMLDACDMNTTYSPGTKSAEIPGLGTKYERAYITEYFDDRRGT